MTKMVTTHRPTPVAWTMLPLALLVIGLGFAGSGFIWQRTTMTYLAMDHLDLRYANAAKPDRANPRSHTAQSSTHTEQEASVPPINAAVSTDRDPQSLASASLDDPLILPQAKAPLDDDQNPGKLSGAETKNSELLSEESDTSNISDPDEITGPDLSADILAQLSKAMDDSHVLAEPSPAPQTPDDDQVEESAVEQITDEVENDFIVLTLEGSAENTTTVDPQVPMFVGEKVQISREMVDAVDSGVVQRVITLIDQGESIDAVNSLGESALLKASWNGDTELAEKLLELGASLSMAADDGRTPLYSAAVSGNLKLVELMLERGADVNASTLNGKTPLMVSAWSDYPEMAHLLLRFGADPDKIDNQGRNAIFYALWDRNIEVVKALLESGADLALIDKQGHSTMDIARLRRIILPGMKVESSQQN